jgi:hypothetical protein
VEEALQGAGAVVSNGCIAMVQKVLRHRDPKLTESVYGHLADDFLREGVDRLHFEGMPKPESVASWALGRRGGTRGTQTPPDARKAGTPCRKREDFRPF